VIWAAAKRMPDPVRSYNLNVEPKARADGQPHPLSKSNPEAESESLGLMAAQQPLDLAATSIHHLVAQAGLSDFTGIAIDARTNTLTLYWYGGIPPSVAELLGKLAGTINVRTVQAPYSFATLDAEQRRLMSLRGSPTGPRVIRTGIVPDFSGLAVWLDQRYSSTVTAADADQLRSAVKTVLKTAMPHTPLDCTLPTSD
jgi:hypothetical protein